MINSTKRWKLKNGHKQYLSSPKDEGVGQLAAHIESLENGTFKWDSKIPKQIQYYPILVLESREIIQASLSAIINEWYSNFNNINSFNAWDMPVNNAWNTMPISESPTYVPMDGGNSIGTSSTGRQCYQCKGSGRIERFSHPGTSQAGERKWCNECGKTVLVGHYHTRCPSCIGQGFSKY